MHMERFKYENSKKYALVALMVGGLSLFSPIKSFAAPPLERGDALYDLLNLAFTKGRYIFTNLLCIYLLAGVISCKHTSADTTLLIPMRRRLRTLQSCSYEIFP